MARQHTRRDFVRVAGAAVATTAVAGTASASGRPTEARYAAFNVIDLNTGQVQKQGDPQAAAAARVVQEVRPDVLVVNELANNLQKAEAFEGVPTDRTNIEAFVDNYLRVPQRDDLAGIDYGHTLQPTSNTGVATGFDINNDGVVDTTPGDFGYALDSYGFGVFPGQYAFGIASRYPILEDGIRTFRTFRWEDMPGSRIVTDDKWNWYLNDEEADVFRLSSKTHIDVPFLVDGEVVHGLFAHPTPPVFDGPDNHNGRRNHDEIRLFADYVAGRDYIYDDSGEYGGLDEDASYVLMGDMNADPQASGPLNPAKKFLYDNDDFNTRNLPTSPGGAQRGRPYATTDGEDPLHLDYVLPSPDLSLRASSVVWPSTDAEKRNLGDDVRAASDHRLVWADVAAQ